MFVYDADDALAGFVAPYLDDGREAGEALIAAFVPDKQSLVRDALGPASGDVEFADARDVYTRPESTIATYDTTVRRLLRDGARSIRFVGELPRFEARPQWDPWVLYEALLNRAFAHYPVRIMCTYDERVVPAAVVQASRRAHPRVHDRRRLGDERHDGPELDPAAMVRTLTPEPQPLPGLRETPAGDGCRGLRERLREELAAAEVAPDRAAGLLLAAEEVYVNAVRHAGGPPTLRVGRVDGHFVCELSDGGPGLDDPLAGHLPPRDGARSGAGLWVARQCTARLEHLPIPGGGLTTRLWV